MSEITICGQYHKTSFCHENRRQKYPWSRKDDKREDRGGARTPLRARTMRGQTKLGGCALCA